MTTGCLHNERDRRRDGAIPDTIKRSPRPRRERKEMAMNKVAIVVLADTESHGDLGRVVNALEVVREFNYAGDEVTLIFDGAGVKWVHELSSTNHKAAPLFAAVKDKVAGACEYCASAFGVKQATLAAGVGLLGNHVGHPSFRTPVSDGYLVITF
jgi:hypothetical protein